MEIEVLQEDRVDTNVTVIENGKDVKEMQGVYYYYLNENLFKTGEGETASSNTEILGLSDAIQNVVYVPYFNEEHLKLQSVPFDIDRYGWEQAQGSNPPLCYRVDRYPTNKTLEISTFNCFDLSGRTLGGVRNWRNESALYHYPYSFGILTDFIGENYQFKFHLCRKENTQQPFVRTCLSNFGTYNYGVLGYKGDENGQIEGVVNNKSLDLPNSSSAYSQWSASSRNVTEFNQSIGFLQGVNNVVGGAFSFNPQGLIHGGLSIADSVGSVIAMKNDLRNTPNTMLSMGNDVNFSKGISGARALQEKGGLYFMRYGLTNDYYMRLGDYFAMYGYAINRVQVPNFRSRKYYNYIEVPELNCIGNDVPKNHLKKVKEIFAHGITFWHVKNGEMFDYSKDNIEV